MEVCKKVIVLEEAKDFYFLKVSTNAQRSPETDKVLMGEVVDQIVPPQEDHNQQDNANEAKVRQRISYQDTLIGFNGKGEISIGDLDEKDFSKEEENCK